MMQDAISANDRLYVSAEDIEAKVILSENSVNAIQSYLDENTEGAGKEVALVALKIWRERSEEAKRASEAERDFQSLKSVLDSNEKMLNDTQSIRQRINTCDLCENSISAIRSYLENHEREKPASIARVLMNTWNQRLEKASYVLPNFIDRIPPVYPRLAQQAGIEGVVYVSVHIDESGDVIDAKIEKNSGTKAGLEEASLVAAGKSTFSPAIRCGKPIKSWATFPFRFRILGG